MIQLPPLSDPLWSQDEAIAFEAARECLGDMMAICSAAIHEVKCTSQADPQRLANLEAELAALAAEKKALLINRLATELHVWLPGHVHEMDAGVASHRSKQRFGGAPVKIARRPGT